MIFRVNDNFAVAVQYEFGDRELVSGDFGDNHPVSLVVSATAGQNDKTSAIATADVVAPSLGNPTPRAVIQQAVPQDAGASRYPRL